MTLRAAKIDRKTAETDITLKLRLDGAGNGDIATGVGFLDHMLTLFAKHACFDLYVRCTGDTQVDAHHTVEDAGICLGAALKEALGDMRGVARYGDITLPMDEALVLCAVDVSGRGGLAYDPGHLSEKIGDMDTELVGEFFAAFCRKSGITVHVRRLAGANTHHVIEACFKAFARALAKAVAIDREHQDEIPSTKGLL